MAGEQLTRPKLAHFMDTAPGTSTPTYNRIGEGHSDLSVSTNPEIETQQWIDQESATSFLKSYAISIDATQIAFKGDPVFDFVDDLGFKQAVLSDAETTVIEARIYKSSTTSGPYPAKRWRVNIAVNNYGGAGSDPLQHEYTISVMGDPTFGTFDLDTLAFTATA